MSIFIPLKIAKRKRYKNTIGGVIHEAIQIAAESDLSTKERCLHIQQQPGDVSSFLIQQGERRS